LATLAFCGSYAGVVLGMPLSGFLIGEISWQAPFYFYGVAGLIW
jgi:MFS transporter, ACS family, solute carrier family 17 (sodium-dependent inorganic phosphate cotransporter), member 6/7/8